MAKMKVQLVDGIKRVVFIDTEATKGAVIGTNLYMPGGALATGALLRSYLGINANGSVATQHSQLQGLDANDHPQYALTVNLSAVAFSGVYADLTGKPTLGTAAALNIDTDVALAANSDSIIATQKATKAYVDGKVEGLSWKQAVRAATTVAGTLATSFENGDTIDGVVLATGDRILIKNQAAGAENGIYTVNASGAPTRALDVNTGAELVNASVYISEGTTLADTQWTCTTNAPITVGVTALVFAQLSSGGGTTVATDTIWDAAGDLVVGTGANTAARLAIGSEGQVLSVVSGTPEWAAMGTEGALEFVGSAEVTGAAATTLTLSGLDLDADEIYCVVISAKNATASSTTVSLYYNADTTATNYFRDLASNGASTQANNANVFSLSASTSAIGLIHATLAKSTYPLFRASVAAGTISTATIRAQSLTHQWAVASTNVTGITLSASVANSLAIGTKIWVWKYKSTVSYTPNYAEQGSDLVVTSNAAYQNTSITVALPAAGTYVVEGETYTLSAVTPGSRVRLNYTGTTSSAIGSRRTFTTASAAINGGHSTALPHETGNQNAAETYVTQWRQTFTVTSAGTFSVQVKQETSSGTSITFKAGSYMRVRRVA